MYLPLTLLLISSYFFYQKTYLFCFHAYVIIYNHRTEIKQICFTRSFYQDILKNKLNNLNYLEWYKYPELPLALGGNQVHSISSYSKTQHLTE